jgi:uncharacterized protein (TIGR02147 family)
MKTVFEYTNYHRYLSDYYAFLKSLDRKYSYRYICAKTRIKSPGHLAAILQGKAHISHALTMRFVAFCKLKKREADYFQCLVMYNQAKSHDEKKTWFEKMTRFAESAVHQVHADQYRFYEKWHHAALWALLDVYDSDGSDPRALGQMVEPSLTAAQVRQSLKLLHTLGMIAADQRGNLKPVHDIIDTGTRPPAVAVNAYTLQMLDKAKEALDRFAREERSISWATVSLSERGYRELLEEARTFRKRVMHIAAHDNAQRVYQVMLQLFPLSKHIPGADAEESA